ncbi:MAG: hypothetical protein H0T41_04150 [Rhodobacteraceae bacterium]|nr:hypothetical protein [Paracoccaceae bacterium]
MLAIMIFWCKFCDMATGAAAVAAIEGGNMQSSRLSFAVPFAGAVLFYGLSTTPAHAYLDPGTGSMILQVLLGGVAGVALAGKLYWHRLLTMVGVRSEPVGGDGAEADAASTSPRADS